MSEKPFLLVSLEEEKSKKLAQVLSNDTARKILDYLSKKEHASESELAKKLKIPISTVHYNMEHLVKADLVNDESFSYSEKGKEITHYALSNKYVIIAPKKTDKLKEKLKDILPVIGILGAVSATLHFFQKQRYMFGNSMEYVAQEEALDIAPKAAGMARDAMVEMDMVGNTQQVAEQTVTTVQQEPSIAFWFFIGAVFGLLCVLIWKRVRIISEK